MLNFAFRKNFANNVSCVSTQVFPYNINIAVATE